MSLRAPVHGNGGGPQMNVRTAAIPASVGPTKNPHNARHSFGSGRRSPVVSISGGSGGLGSRSNQHTSSIRNLQLGASAVRSGNSTPAATPGNSISAPAPGVIRVPAASDAVACAHGMTPRLPSGAFTPSTAAPSPILTDSARHVSPPYHAAAVESAVAVALKRCRSELAAEADQSARLKVDAANARAAEAEETAQRAANELSESLQRLVGAKAAAALYESEASEAQLHISSLEQQVKANLFAQQRQAKEAMQRLADLEAQLATQSAHAADCEAAAVEAAKQSDAIAASEMSAASEALQRATDSEAALREAFKRIEEEEQAHANCRDKLNTEKADALSARRCADEEAAAAASANLRADRAQASFMEAEASRLGSVAAAQQAEATAAAAVLRAQSLEELLAVQAQASKDSARCETELEQKLNAANLITAQLGKELEQARTELYAAKHQFVEELHEERKRITLELEASQLRAQEEATRLRREREERRKSNPKPETTVRDMTPLRSRPGGTGRSFSKELRSGTLSAPVPVVVRPPSSSNSPSKADPTACEVNSKQRGLGKRACRPGILLSSILLVLATAPSLASRVGGTWGERAGQLLEYPVVLYQSFENCLLERLGRPSARQRSKLRGGA
eukprot:TRINITY_DN27150_c0_g1_i2.p1 TRINITY_DN27150_c0_g1~~TRINITY_DN27150_c0_g1_i2.p1  ORF type:complete len:628 (+),score=133.78 TRINITY_DN27150_c0_g1_i2:15-1898(+)